MCSQSNLAVLPMCLCNATYVSDIVLQGCVITRAPRPAALAGSRNLEKHKLYPLCAAQVAHIQFNLVRKRPFNDAPLDAEFLLYILPDLGGVCCSKEENAVPFLSPFWLLKSDLCK